MDENEVINIEIKNNININLNYIYIIITEDLFKYESEDLKNEIILEKSFKFFGDYLIKENKKDKFDIKTL